MKKTLFLALMWVVGAAAANGQTIDGTTEKSTYGIDEVILIIYRTESEIESADPLAEDGFMVVAGPSIHRTAQIVNGVTSRSTEYRWVIRAEAPGTVEIASPVFIIDGHKCLAEPITLTITGELPSGQNTEPDNNRDNNRNDNRNNNKGNNRNNASQRGTLI